MTDKRHEEFLQRLREASEEMHEYERRAKRELIRRELPFFFGTAIVLYSGCWMVSFFLGSLPSSQGKFGEKLGGLLLGGGITYLSKEAGHVGIFWGGVVGWAIYILHFLYKL